MILGYARISTKKQKLGTSLEDQIEVLEKEGCEKIFKDVYSGTKLDRQGFNKLCESVFPGDTIVVTKLDRIARTAREASDLILGWVRSGVKVRVLNMGLIEDTEIGRLILNVLLSFAEFERDMIVRRTQEGRAYKRATDANYKEGRAPVYRQEQRDLAMELLKTHSFKDVTKMTGMSRATLAREARKRNFRKSETGTLVKFSSCE